MKPKKLDNRLDMLVREIQDWYYVAVRNCDLAGPLNMGGYVQEAEICESLIRKINEIYQTNYELKEIRGKRK